MKLVAIPIMFTLMALTISILINRNINHRVTRSWDQWDTKFTVFLVLAAVLPTWTVYFTPHWQMAVLWTVIGITSAHFAPIPVDTIYTKEMGKHMQYCLGVVCAVVAWITWMILFCERQWHHTSLV